MKKKKKKKKETNFESLPSHCLPGFSMIDAAVPEEQSYLNVYWVDIRL